MLDIAQAKDKADSLSSKRTQFALPAGVIYLDGNSLGPLPHNAIQRAEEVVSQQWGNDLITSWNKHHWIDLPVTCGEQIAPIIGAAKGQVVCCDSISVNLFKVLSAALQMQGKRKKIVTTSDNFPTDIYTVEGLQQLLGTERCELVLVDEQDIETALGDEVAVLLLTQVNFRTGRVLDIRKLTALAQAKGILTVWDLAHSAGALPVNADVNQVDFAVGCTYKYLNGGPGAPAFIYVAQRHQARYQQPFSGWMGHANPFSFNHHYEPVAGPKQNLSGTPAVISMSVLHAALEVWDNVNIAVIREKSLALGEFFLAAISALGIGSELVCVSPSIPESRGSQLAFQHPHSYAICQAWIDCGVIADFRAPDLLRVGFAPLYLSFTDVWVACEKLAQVMRSNAFLAEKYQQRQAVT